MSTEPTFERGIITFLSGRLTIKVESSGHGQNRQVMDSHRVLIRYMQFATLKISTRGIYRLPGTLNGSASFAKPMILNMG